MRYERYHITFRCNIKQLETDLPPGLDIARKIHNGFLQRGIHVSELEVWRDSAWSWECFPEEKRTNQVDIVLSAFEPNMWLIACNRARHFFSFFIRRSKSVHFLAVTEVLILILAEEPFSEVKWYFKQPAFAKNALGVEVTSIEDIEIV